MGTLARWQSPLVSTIYGPVSLTDLERCEGIALLNSVVCGDQPLLAANKKALSGPIVLAMFDVALHEPEIAPNTGNLMRLTVNTGCRLHLIEPLGFSLDEAKVRRAGLDYREYAQVETHRDWLEFLDSIRGRRIFAFSQHATAVYTDVFYQRGDVLLFGKESAGLPEAVLANAAITEQVRIPIAPKGRSLNLANAAAIGVYEAWRQVGFTMPEAVQ